MFGMLFADEGFTAPSVSFGLHPTGPTRAQPKLVGWCPTTHEIGILPIPPAVRAFLTRVSTTPSADFCPTIRMSCPTLSHGSR